MINPRSQCRVQERKNNLHHYLFGDKIIQNCLKYDNDLFLRQETPKRLCVLETDIINFDLMSLAQRIHFLQGVFRMTAIALVSVINHCHIKGCIYFETPSII